MPVIEEFLPAAMSDAELAALVDAAVAETGAESMRDMGRVMGLVTARGEGRADGGVASALVRDRLSAWTFGDGCFHERGMEDAGWHN